MAVSSSLRSVTYEGDGATSTWPVNFRVLEKAHLVVTHHEGDVDTPISPTDFAVTTLPANACTVTYPLSGSLADGATLTIERIVPLTQPTTFTGQGGYFAESMEAAIDRVVMMAQQISETGGGDGGGGIAGVATVNSRAGHVILDRTDVGLNLADNKSSATIRSEITAGNVTAALGFTPENAANRGNANGYAPLGPDGKISPSYLSASGAQIYKGGWNATTNSPTIPAAASGNNGWYYIVTTAGTTTIDGISSWAVGDWIISNGATWQKVVNADAVVSVAGLTGAITAASLRTALSLSSFYLPLGGGTLTGAVAGVTPTLSAHLATKGYVDSVASAGGGYVSVAADTDGGTINLTGANNGIAFVTTDGIDDMMFWKLFGLPLGGKCQVVFDRNSAFLFNSGFSGANIVGHYEGVERMQDGNRMGTMTVRAKDVISIIRQLDGAYRVWFDNDSYLSRIGWQAPGDSRDPEEAYTAIGQVGLWSDIKGIPYGDALFWHQGTVRKPIFGGLNLRGVGDTCPLFIEVFRAEDQDEGEGLNNPKYAVPWDDPYRIGSHISFRQRIADANGKLIICDGVPVGAEGGPGSLNQGISAQFDFFTTALPTSTSTPGGVTIRSTRPGINCPIDVASATPSGTFLIHGQAALEAYGTFGACISGGRLTEANGQMWHGPSLDVDRSQLNWYGDLQMIASPMQSGRQYAAWSVRSYGDHGRGADFGERTDEQTYWMFGVNGAVRTRVWGIKPTDPGAFVWGDGLLERGSYRSINDDQFYKWVLGASKSGRMSISMNDHNAAIDLAFSTDSTGIIKLMTTATSNALFDVASGTATNGSGTDGKITVYCDGTGVSVSNRFGSAQNFRVKFEYA